MEGKVILYIVMGVGYLLYSLYQKGLKEQEKQASRKSVSKPVSPPTKSIFEQALEEIKQQQSITKERSEQNKPQPIFTRKEKDFFVTQKVNPKFEEGKTAFNLYERQLTAEETRANEAEKTRFLATSKAFDEINDNEPIIEFDARQALISSIIFERKI